MTAGGRTGPGADAPDPSDTLDALLREKYEPIAIVGVGLRFPGGSGSLDDFDEFLRDGRSGIRTIPEDRWDVAAFTPEGPEDKGKIRTTSGGFLDRIDMFDAPFFNISPKEAQYIDPQQRMVLETAWKALEHANIDPGTLRRGNGGVYIGASSIDYALELDGLSYPDLDGHLASGITMFPLSGRLSYFLGMRGPSVSIDTACSSALVALHMAVQGLRRGECEIALCGGVNAMHHPRIPVMFSHAQMLAPDGRCKTFDESADGYARAEGCGVVVLKRQSDAERDGDQILALIRGSAVGQDGDSTGLTVPSGTGQELTIRRALRNARLEPGDIQYVEAHGTGTPLGDPIEIGALNDVFACSHTKDAPLLVGSVKTNLGHMEPASGLVGLIKVVTQLGAGTVYPHLNLTVPSGRIPWDRYPITVPTRCVPWEAPVRRAVVNSFGFAGTIAAVVVEQGPTRPPAPRPADTAGAGRGVDVLTVSARTEAALREQLALYRRHVEDSAADLADLCYTSNVGRTGFGHRVGIVAADRDDLLTALDREIDRAERTGPKVSRKIAFLFSGQGAQYPGMGADLHRRFPGFARDVDECDRLFAPLLGESVRALLLGDHPHPDLIDQTMYTQPALFALEYALARLWMSWGVRPSVLVGHSIGEVAAATIAGVLGLEDAVTLVAARSRLMQSVPEPGGMAAVGAPVEDVAPLLAGYPDLTVAAVNTPTQCVVSGGAAALDAVLAELREKGLRVDRLTASHAFHSPLMHPVLEEFRASIADIEFREPAITLISNVTGAVARPADIATPDYWVRHIAEPVLFMAGIRAATRRGGHTFVEIGPSTALTALAKQCVPAEEHLWWPSLRRRDRDGATTVRSLAELYTAGAPVRWADVHEGRTLRRVALPSYPFQRRSYWLPAGGAARSGAAVVPVGAAHHPLLGAPLAGTGTVRELVTQCDATTPRYLADNVDGSSVALPVAAYLETLLAAQDAVLGRSDLPVRDIALGDPVPLPDETVAELRTRVAGDRVTVDATVDGVTRHCASATFLDRAGPGTPVPQPGPVLGTVRAADLYVDLRSVGRTHGDGFRLVGDVHLHEDRSTGDTVLTAEVGCRDSSPVELFPVETLDAVLQVLTAADQDGPLRRPVRIAGMRLLRKPRTAALRVVAVVRRAAARRQVADVVVLDGDVVLLELTGVESTVPIGASPFLHRLEWLRRSAAPAPVSRPRHAVTINADVSDLPAAIGDGAEVAVTQLAGPDELAAALADPR